MYFSAEQLNYARWIAQYKLNLINANVKVKSYLGQSGLSVQRTNKSFSRCLVDITLEQTVNADAESQDSQHTGIAAFTNSEAARKQWMITRSLRSAIVRYVWFEKNQRWFKGLKKHRILKDNSDLKHLGNGIKESLNPFDPKFRRDDLISSGCNCSEYVKNDMMHCKEIGQKWYDEFQME